MLKAMQVAHVDEIITPGFQIPPMPPSGGGGGGAGLSINTGDNMAGQQPPNI